MSKFEVVCPFCRKPNAVEKNSFGACAHGLQDVQCSQCSKRWEENLTNTGRLKSATVPSGELAALRVQVRAQMDELVKKINGLIGSSQKNRLRKPERHCTPPMRSKST